MNDFFDDFKEDEQQVNNWEDIINYDQNKNDINMSKPVHSKIVIFSTIFIAILSITLITIFSNRINSPEVNKKDQILQMNIGDKFQFKTNKSNEFIIEIANSTYYYGELYIYVESDFNPHSVYNYFYIYNDRGMTLTHSSTEFNAFVNKAGSDKIFIRFFGETHSTYTINSQFVRVKQKTFYEDNIDKQLATKTWFEKGEYSVKDNYNIHENIRIDIYDIRGKIYKTVNSFDQVTFDESDMYYLIYHTNNSQLEVIWQEEKAIYNTLSIYENTKVKSVRNQFIYNINNPTNNNLVFKFTDEYGVDLFDVEIYLISLNGNLTYLRKREGSYHIGQNDNFVIVHREETLYLTISIYTSEALEENKQKNINFYESINLDLGELSVSNRNYIRYSSDRYIELSVFSYNSQTNTPVHMMGGLELVFELSNISAYDSYYVTITSLYFSEPTNISIELFLVPPENELEIEHRKTVDFKPGAIFSFNVNFDTTNGYILPLGTNTIVDYHIFDMKNNIIIDSRMPEYGAFLTSDIFNSNETYFYELLDTNLFPSSQRKMSLKNIEIENIGYGYGKNYNTSKTKYYRVFKQSKEVVVNFSVEYFIESPNFYIYDQIGKPINVVRYIYLFPLFQNFEERDYLFIHVPHELNEYMFYMALTAK